MLPVIVGLATGERPGALQYAGHARGLRRRRPRHPAGLRGERARRLARGVGAGRASRRSASAASTSASTPRSRTSSRSGRCSPREPAPASCWSRRCSPCARRLALAPADLPSLAAIGLLDVGANALIVLGTDTGLVSVVAVLGSLYPVATVVLARAVLGERRRSRSPASPPRSPASRCWPRLTPSANVPQSSAGVGRSTRVTLGSATSRDTGPSTRRASRRARSGRAGTARAADSPPRIVVRRQSAQGQHLEAVPGVDDRVGVRQRPVADRVVVGGVADDPAGRGRPPVAGVARESAAAPRPARR